jgi:hypothetical protein
MKTKKHTKKQGKHSLVFQQYGNGRLHVISDGSTDMQKKKNKRFTEKKHQR